MLGRVLHKKVCHKRHMSLYNLLLHYLYLCFDNNTLSMELEKVQVKVKVQVKEQALEQALEQGLVVMPQVWQDDLPAMAAGRGGAHG